MSRPCAVPLVVLALLALAPRRPAAAQAGLRDWRTIAGGDEVLSLAVDPADPYRLAAGTEGGGLVIWDLAAGNDFTQHLFPTQPGLMSNTVLDLAFDGRGDLWLATDAGVTHAAGASWTAFTTADGLPDSSITAIGVGDDDTVWAGTRDAGVLSYRPGGQWTVHAANGSAPAEGPGTNAVADIAVDVDGSGRVWVAHGRASSGEQPALSVFDPETGTWEHVAKAPVGTDPIDAPATDQVLALAFDEATRDLWLGTWAEGVLAYDRSTWRQYGTADGLCGRNVLAVEATGGSIWAACEDGGAAVLDAPSGTWTAWTEAQGLPTDTVLAIAVTNGVAYLGTNGPGDGASGIVPLDGRPADALRTAPAAPWSNDVTTIAFEPDGTLWAGTRGQGLMRFDGSEWEQMTAAGTDDDGRPPYTGIASDTVTDLALRGDELWVSTMKMTVSGGEYVDGGVSILDLGTDRWLAPLRIDASYRCQGLPARDARALAVEASGARRVWIGFGAAAGEPGPPQSAHTGSGVVAYDPASGAWECYTSEDTSGALAGNTVSGLAVWGADVWAATSYHKDTDGRSKGGGVSQLAGGRWTSWTDGVDGLRTYSATREGGDPITGDVRAVMMDAGGRAWAGTWDLDDPGQLVNVWPRVDAVINRREGATWAWDVFPGSGWVSAIAEHVPGEVWIGTTRGHALQEFVPAGGGKADTSTGGAYIWTGADWQELTPSRRPDLGTSGIGSTAITSLAVDPTTGYMWVGTENAGFSVYESGQAQPSATPCLTCPTATLRPASTATVQVVVTLPPPTAGPGAASPTPAPGAPTRAPEPEPPPEVPEAGTLVLLGAGLAALAGYARRRRGGAGGNG